MELSWLGLTWEVLLIAAGCGLAAAAVLLIARRLLAWLLGPIFTYETVRLARKGHTFWLRTAFALLILGLLYTAKPEDKPPSSPHFISAIDALEDPVDDPMARFLHAERGRMEKFAADFTQSLMLALALAVMLVTPLYTGTAVSEEKEKRTLDFLLATRLGSNDIVVGKLAARLLNLFAITLVPLPILALTQLWGGVDWRLIAYGFALILLALLSYACVGLMCSVVFARSRNAVLAAFTIVLGCNLAALALEEPPAYCFTSIALMRNVAGLYTQFDHPMITSGTEVIIARHFPFVIVHFALLIVGLAVATARLRFFAARHAGGPCRVMKAVTPGGDGAPIVPHPLTVAPNPPVHGDALVWKEQYLGRTVGGWLLRRTFWVYSLLLMGIVLVAAIAVRLEGAQDALPEFRMVMRVVAIVLGLLVLLSTSLSLASSVSREREQQTLVSLLTLPVTRAQILQAKWLGTLLRASWALAGLAMGFVVTGILTDFPLSAWLFLPLVYGAHVWFFGNLGLLLSVFCRTTNRASSLFLVVLVVIVAGSWTASYLEGRLADRDWHRHYDSLDDEMNFTRVDHHWPDLDELVNPSQTWWRMTGLRSRSAGHLELGSRIAFGAGAGYFFGGLLLWLFALTAFRRGTRS